MFRTCDMPGHAVYMSWGNQPAWSRTEPRLKNNSFAGLEKQSTSFSWPPPASSQRDWDFCGPCRLPVAWPDPWESSSNTAPLLPASPPHVRLLDCAYENNSYVPVYYFSWADERVGGRSEQRNLLVSSFFKSSWGLLLIRACCSARRKE